MPKTLKKPAAKKKATKRPAEKKVTKGAAPRGQQTVTAAITCVDSRREIVFLKAAFGAEKRMAMLWPGTNRIMHAQVTIGSSVLMLTDAMPDNACSRPAKDLGGSPASFYVYVPDVDATFARAVKAGAKPTCPVSDTFWGDRMGAVECPEGFQWSIATHQHDYTQAEMEEKQAEFFAQFNER